ncbi:MAG: hypothetical protein AUJ49_13400 [Desulfovibrionaceae bacterium CG1_02_65_16]|nr:MAG: hypothetical protein AUJ49_13400 [Desulfovibrionaceae bacterium CG1_02_65_16]
MRRSIAVGTWSRREQYRYFSGMPCPYCSLTCEIDVSAACGFMKDNGIPSYVGMIYLVTKAANSIPELRVRGEGDAVFAYDIVHPSFTILNERQQLYFCRSPYVADPNIFVPRTREIIDRTRAAPECPLTPTGPDWLYLSCIPWVHFTSVSHPMNFNQQDAIPRITWGRYEPRAGGLVMAVNLQVHHGFADGLHISQFMLALERCCADPEDGFAGWVAAPRSKA